MFAPHKNCTQLFDTQHTEAAGRSRQAVVLHRGQGEGDDEGGGGGGARGLAGEAGGEQRHSDSTTNTQEQ